MDLGGIASATCNETAYYDTFPDDDPSTGGPVPACTVLSPMTVRRLRVAVLPPLAVPGAAIPIFDSGVIVVSDIERGLFVLRVLKAR